MTWWPTKTRKPNEDAGHEAAQPPGEDTHIFTFWDGSAHRRMDPLPIWYALWQTPDIEATIKRAIKNEMEAIIELTAVGRKLLNLQPYDPVTGSGLTELATLNLIGNFLAYCDELKKKVGPLPMPWLKLAPQLSSAPSTTPPAAASSCNPPGSPNVEPSTTFTPSPPPSTAP
jgi:hypothetical protein